MCAIIHSSDAVIENTRTEHNLDMEVREEEEKEEKEADSTGSVLWRRHDALSIRIVVGTRGALRGPRCCCCCCCCCGCSSKNGEAFHQNVDDRKREEAWEGAPGHDNT